MGHKNFTSVRFVKKSFLSVIVSLASTIFYFSGLLIHPLAAQATAAPGGHVIDPIIRAVDIAKPAIVRIITTEQGRLTVHFPVADNSTITFPRGGGQYDLKLSGSGAFISTHGDILTADHVIRPPQDQSMDQYLQILAAQDVADYINQNLHPSVAWTKNDAVGALSSSYLLSTARYEQPTSQVYLSTDYTGPLNATDLATMPEGTSAPVASTEKESLFDQKDVAIIHVNLDDTPSIQLGDSADVAQQDQLTIIGFPGNGDISDKRDPSTVLTSSVNKIYVSAIKQTDTAAPVIQVGGNVEHGDSGGPALDSKGNIVGVVSFGGTDMPDGTSFLQASNSAKELIQSLSLDTKPGKLQKDWNKAFSDYASTSTGHWHLANKEFKQLLDNYATFHALNAYIDYTGTQAATEKIPQKPKPVQSNPNEGMLLGILLLLVIFVIFLLVIFAIRRNKRQVVVAQQGQPMAHYYNNTAAGMHYNSYHQQPQPYPTPLQNATPAVGAASVEHVPFWPPVSPQGTGAVEQQPAQNNSTPIQPEQEPSTIEATIGSELQPQGLNNEQMALPIKQEPAHSADEPTVRYADVASVQAHLKSMGYLSDAPSEQNASNGSEKSNGIQAPPPRRYAPQE